MVGSQALDDTPEGGWKAANGIPVPDFVEPVVCTQQRSILQLLGHFDCFLQRIAFFAELWPYSVD